MVDSALWLGPLDDESPSGVDLRNDSRFHDLERLVEPAVKVVYDDRNKPTAQISSPPDWGAVLERAEEMRQSGRDLRLLTVVTRALANEEKLAGLAQGLGLIAGTIETYWDSLHPALRTGGSMRDAALRRINALLDLQNGQDGLLADLRRLTLFSPRVTGPVTGYDLEQGALDDRAMLQEAASGLNNAERAVLSAAHEQLLTRVRTACLAQIDQNPDEMLALVADAAAAAQGLDAIDKALNAHLGEEGVAVPMLKRFVERVRATLERVTAAKVDGAAAPAAAVAAEPVLEAPLRNGHDGAGMVAAAAPATGLPASISTRGDVVKCLDLVVAFYDRTEPSSPIPHLARRIRRMVPMDFIELMEDLAPSGLKEFRLLAGATDPKKAAQKE